MNGILLKNSNPTPARTALLRALLLAIAASLMLAASAAAESVAPSISGVATGGGELTADPGSLEGVPVAEPAYQWQRCDADAPDDCANIDGATSATYTPGIDDAAKRLRVAVTSGAPPTTAYSAPTDPVTHKPVPVPVAKLFLVGKREVGSLLKIVSSRSWAGYPTPEISYQWYRCSDADSCTPIEGATDTEYMLTADDAGKSLMIDEIATNELGSAKSRGHFLELITTPPVWVGQPPVGPIVAKGLKLQLVVTAPARVHRGNVFSLRLRLEAAQVGLVNVRACVKLPRGVSVLRAGGAKLGRHRACWTRSSLDSGDAVSLKMRLKAGRTAKRSLSFAANVAARDTAGLTIGAAGAARTGLR